MNTITYDRNLKLYTLRVDFGTNYNVWSYADNPIARANLFYDLARLRLNYVYAWDGAKLFADFDNWAIRRKLPDYDEVAPADARGYRPRVNVECYSIRDGDQSYYSRRYWLKTVSKLTTDRHKRLHGVTLVNAQNYFGGRELTEIFKTFQTDILGEVLTKFNDNVSRLTGGLCIFNPNTEKPNFLTLGAISKAYYLRLKYPELDAPQRVKQYQRDYPSDKRIERELRAADLLTGGIIYLKDTDTHYDLYKYDKVSLFPSVERDLPALGVPREVPLDEFTGTFDDGQYYEYIFIFNSLTLKRKPHMPALYPPQGGYTGINLDVITVENEALFAPLYFAYLNYYDVVDSDVKKIYRCRKLHDPAISAYVDTIFKEKAAATDPAYYFIIKLILNNLHGKFAQNPVTPTYTRTQSPTGTVERHTSGIKDNWTAGHFDYIRGAYIYSMARAKMLNDLAKLAEVEEIKAAEGHAAPYRLVDHLYYSDTDSAVLDHAITVDGVVGNNLGQFKDEGEISKFHAYAPKIYAYYPAAHFNPEPVLKCAGAKADEIIDYWRKNWFTGGIKGVIDLIEFLDFDEVLPITTLHRTDIGAEYRTEWRPLTNYSDYDEEGGEL